MGKFSWIDHVRSEEYPLLRVKKRTTILQTTEKRNAKCFGHISRGNCLLKHVLEGEIQRRICDGKTRKKK